MIFDSEYSDQNESEFFSKNTIGQNKNGNYSYEFSESNYKAGLCGSGHKLTGSFTQGNATYDCARTNMGEPWMMPTRIQFDELINYTANIWVTINGVNGRVFISKSDISKSIFIPAGRYWEDTTFDSTDSGVYWSVDAFSSSSAWYMHFRSNIIDTSYDRYRYSGRTIHPIAPSKPW